MNRFVVVGTGLDYVSMTWEDIKNDPDVSFLPSPFLYKNKLLNFLCKAHSSFAINKHLNIPFKRIWKRFYAIDQIEIKNEDIYYFYFYDNSICRYDPKYIHMLKQSHNNVFIVVQMGNAMYKRGALIKRYMDDIDVIYTSNKEDASRYNFIYRFARTNNLKNSVALPLDECGLDVFYAGNAADRLDMIYSVYDRLQEMGLSMEIRVTGVPLSAKRRDGIVYNQPIPYEKIIEKDGMSKCILEVVGNKATTLTLRTLEAIYLKRKLITNNSAILDEVFYDPEFILYFQNPEDIDEEFCRKVTDIKYNFMQPLTARDLLNTAVNDVARRASSV